MLAKVLQIGQYLKRGSFQNKLLVYPELCVPLTKIKTKLLKLWFSQRNLAREVLQMIHLHPKWVLILHETAVGEDK